jgi:hypothetical protein
MKRFNIAGWFEEKQVFGVAFITASRVQRLKENVKLRDANLAVPLQGMVFVICGTGARAAILKRGAKRAAIMARAAARRIAKRGLWSGLITAGNHPVYR